MPGGCAGESVHVRLVATSYPVKVGVGELGALVEADAMGELARAADGELDGVGPVIDGTIGAKGGSDGRVFN